MSSNVYRNVSRLWGTKKTNEGVAGVVQARDGADSTTVAERGPEMAGLWVCLSKKPAGFADGLSHVYVGVCLLSFVETGLRGAGCGRHPRYPPSSQLPASSAHGRTAIPWPRTMVDVTLGFALANGRCPFCAEMRPTLQPRQPRRPGDGAGLLRVPDEDSLRHNPHGCLNLPRSAAG